MKISEIKEILKFVREHLEENIKKQGNNEPEYRNRYEHTRRVLKYCLKICTFEGVDKDIVTAAALFHDAAKYDSISSEGHAQRGSELCEEYLYSRGFSQDFVIRVSSAVAKHSYKEEDIELSIEEKVLMDADTLDELGAISCIWDAMVVACGEAPSYKKVYLKTSEYLNKYIDKEKYLRTETGRTLYREKLDFIRLYLENLRKELYFR